MGIVPALEQLVRLLSVLLLSVAASLVAFLVAVRWRWVVGGRRLVGLLVLDLVGLVGGRGGRVGGRGGRCGGRRVGRGGVGRGGRRCCGGGVGVGGRRPVIRWWRPGSFSTSQLSEFYWVNHQGFT